MTRSRSLLRAFGICGLCVAPAAGFVHHTGTGSASDAPVTLVASFGAGIHPGGSRAVSFTAANRSDAPVPVRTVHLAGVTTDEHHAGCDTTAFTMRDVPQAVEIPIGATAQALPAEGSLVFENAATNQDACKDATLTLTVTATSS